MTQQIAALVGIQRMTTLAHGAREQVRPLICEGMMNEDGAFVSNFAFDKRETNRLALIDRPVDQMGD